MPDLSVFGPLLSQWPKFVPLLAILALVKIVGSSSFKGWFGERTVIRSLRRLDPSNYRVFHNLYLPHPDGKGTTQIDHVVVSTFGIFVIETKNFRGWIFGSEKQPRWTQQIYRRKNRFPNPLHQNKLHLRALAKYLQLPPTHFHSIVLFIGGCELKTPMPENVITRGLISHIRRHVDPSLDDRLRLAAIHHLDTLDRSLNRRAAARAHLRDLRNRRAA